MSDAEPAPLALFASCPRGLEGVLGDELVELGIKAPLATSGGVAFAGNWEDAYRANLRSRVASRILCRVAAAPYASVDDIYELALAQPWTEWFGPDQTIRVDVSTSGSPLESLDFATLRIKDGVCDRMRRDTGKRNSVDTAQPDVRLAGFVDASNVTLYVDLSGQPLFRRGWRIDAGAAPLRENLAAGILRLSGWRPGATFFDPMCGSGTLVVEAALWACGIDAGAQRSFGFERLRTFDAALWSRLREAPVPAFENIHVHASDISGDAIVLTRQHLVRAGLGEDLAEAIAPHQIDARQIRPPAPEGVLVANLPYGERASVRGATDERAFMAEFGDNLKKRFAGWQCHFMTSDRDLPSKLRLAPRRRVPLYNGAIDCRLFAFDMTEGPHRRKGTRPAEA